MFAKSIVIKPITELCIDPRYEHTVIEAVHLAEEAYNKKNPTDQR